MNYKLMISSELKNVELQKQIDELKKQNNILFKENKLINDELIFYKSIFKTHRKSVIFNLKQKFKKGERVWIDRRFCDRNDILDLDQDDETREWLKPIRCER